MSADDDAYFSIAIPEMTRRVTTAIEAGPGAVESLRRCILGDGTTAGHGPFCDLPECRASWSWSIPASDGGAA